MYGLGDGVPQTHPPAQEAEVEFGEFKAYRCSCVVRGNEVRGVP